jgi:chromosomal replication initiator protein
MITLRQSISDTCHALTDEGQMLPPTNQSSPQRLYREHARQHDWDGFLTLPENRSAVQAIRGLSRAFLAGKRMPFCPLVLHGPPGTGKTLLTTKALQALTHKANGATGRSVAAGELGRPDDKEGFADSGLQECDFLIIEDIQHLSARTSDAACDLIDHRTARGKPFVVSANAGPARLTHLPRRLTSRLAAGLVVQMEPLGMASRRKILEAAAKASKTRLTPDAFDWMLEHSDGVRAAIGYLQILKQIARGFGPLDQKAVEQILAGTGQPTSTRGDPHQIVKRVAAVFGISKKELLGTSRLRNVLIPRQVAMYLTRVLTKLSFPQIGTVFAGRDHTTVLHACRKVEAELEGNETLAAIVKQVKRELS